MGSLSARYDEGYDKQAIDERITAAQRAARDGMPNLKNFNMDHQLVSVKWNSTKQAATGEPSLRFGQEEVAFSALGCSMFYFSPSSDECLCPSLILCLVDKRLATAICREQHKLQP